MGSGTKARRWLAELESIRIPVAGRELRRYRAWEKRRLTGRFATWEAIRFADEWLAPLSEGWLAAAATHRWEPSSRHAHVPEECKTRDEIVDHVADSDGQVMHLLVDGGNPRVALRAERCFRGSPDRVFDHTWTDADRLTREEISAETACRGCGRPFFGGPQLVPMRDRTPEQAAAIEAEESEFRAAHPDCHAGRWLLGDGGVHHCSRCCAPPPPPEAAIETIARIFADVRRRQDELEQRWNAARPKSAAGATVAPQRSQQPDVERLRRRARAAGYRLVPIDE
jgi:hypothetical protein